MKRIIFIAAIILFNLQAYAQDQPLRLAVVLSPQISWMDSDHENASSNGNSFGYNFGVIMDRFFAPNYAFTTGLTVNSTGGKLKFNEGIDMEVGGTIREGVTNITYDLKYLEIPFGLKLLTNEFHRSRYYAQFGLFTQFNIQAQDNNKKTLSQEVNFFDMGYNLGGGIEYSLGGTTHLTAGVLFNNGFMDITDNAALNDKVNLNRLTFQLGVIF